MKDSTSQYTTSMSHHGSKGNGDWTEAAPTSRKRPITVPGASKGKFGDQLANSLRFREARREDDEVYSFGVCLFEHR